VAGMTQVHMKPCTVHVALNHMFVRFVYAINHQTSHPRTRA
jgi:hypothetical protein